MAVISTFKQSGDHRFGTIVSGDAAATDSILLELTEPTLPHSFLGIRMFDTNGDEIDVGGDTGEFTITAALDCSRHLEALTAGVLNAAALVSASALGPLRRINVAVSSALSAGVVTWRLEVRSYSS